MDRARRWSAKHTRCSFIDRWARIAGELERALGPIAVVSQQVLDAAKGVGSLTVAMRRAECVNLSDSSFTTTTDLDGWSNGIPARELTVVFGDDGRILSLDSE